MHLPNTPAHTKEHWKALAGEEFHNRSPLSSAIPHVSLTALCATPSRLQLLMSISEVTFSKAWKRFMSYFLGSESFHLSAIKNYSLFKQGTLFSLQHLSTHSVLSHSRNYKHMKMRKRTFINSSYGKITKAKVFFFPFTKCQSRSRDVFFVSIWAMLNLLWVKASIRQTCILAFNFSGHWRNAVEGQYFHAIHNNAIKLSIVFFIILMFC